MPKKDVILNLPSFSIQKITGFNPTLIDVVYRRVPRCPHCNSKRLRKKDSFIRCVRHMSIGLGTTILRFKAHNFIVAIACGILINASLALIKLSALLTNYIIKSFNTILKALVKKI